MERKMKRIYVINNKMLANVMEQNVKKPRKYDSESELVLNAGGSRRKPLTPERPLYSKYVVQPRDCFPMSNEEKE